MRGGLLLGLAGAALIAIVAAPGAAPPASTVPREVSSAILACPEDLAGKQSWRALSFGVSLGAADPTAGQAWARGLDSDDRIATIESVGDPVAILSPGQSVPTTVIEGEDGFAPGLSAAVVGAEASGPARGLDSGQCVAPAAQWWFVGSGSDARRDATLLVSNPTAQQARFDIEIIGMSGPIEAVGSRGLDLAPQAQARIRLSALAEGERVLSVHVTATTGRVGAALWDVAEPHAAVPQGVDFLAASVAPRRELVFAGIPSGAGARDLVLVNSGAQLATASLRLLTPAGSTELASLHQVVVPAGRIVTVDLARALTAAGGALRLISDHPLTGAVRISSTGELRDLAWLAATDPTGPDNPLASAVMVAGPGLVSSIAVASGNEPVSGTLTYVTSDRTPTDAATPEPGSERTHEIVSGHGQVRTVTVAVPRDSQVLFDVPGSTHPALVTASWRAAPGSGMAHVAHSTSGAAGLTGYQWWPTVSTVRVDEVREDAGTLMGQ